MNKALIKKYKVEFDHWLNGGKLQAKFVNDPWEEAPEDIFSYSTVNFVLAIEDEYVEFRKAIAEGGKTIQYYVDGFVGWQDVKSLNQSYMDPTSFRIKPEEPEESKFIVGDWVIDTQDGALYKIKEIQEFPEEPMYKRFTFSDTEETWIDIYNDEIDTDGWELWQPITGEWCWVFNYLREVPNLRRVVKVEDNFKNRFDDGKFTKAVRVSRGDTLSDEVGYRFCEPFIGQLPTSIKEQNKG